MKHLQITRIRAKTAYTALTKKRLTKRDKAERIAYHRALAQNSKNHSAVKLLDNVLTALRK